MEKLADLAGGAAAAGRPLRERQPADPLRQREVIDAAAGARVSSAA